MHGSLIESLYVRHRPELLGFLTRRTGCQEQAADLCQEIYLRLSRTPDTGLPDDARAYLFRIARNLLIDQHRRSAPTVIALDSVEATLSCPRACPETTVCDRQCAHQLQDLLARLPPRLRQALIWHRLEGLTQREIGERLGVSERMAGRYVTQALSQCQAALAAMEGGD
ncbi:RNA polymerase sigma factor [Salinicola aestuarinus]|uniref:RNA polymerase sigma factor n=1 Tax=Salinicola aestuarinus TaxID=1949082 RepID=UPI000DA267BF|nr:sigma-70 family RNA polymerase sigma factor [Salinicola aestuarinus]